MLQYSIINLKILNNADGKLSIINDQSAKNTLLKIKLVVFEPYNLSTFKTNGLLYLSKSKTTLIKCI